MFFFSFFFPHSWIHTWFHERPKQITAITIITFTQNNCVYTCSFWATHTRTLFMFVCAYEKAESWGPAERHWLKWINKKNMNMTESRLRAEEINEVNDKRLLIIFHWRLIKLRPCHLRSALRHQKSPKTCFKFLPGLFIF